jgi:predicted DNA-binding protein
LLWFFKNNGYNSGMTLSISLPPETEARLRQRAAALGKDIADVAREAVEEKLAIPESFAEILAPIHQATVQAGGVNVDDVDALVEQCRDEVFAAKQTKRTA